jgi:hypothetical protein
MQKHQSDLKLDEWVKVRWSAYKEKIIVSEKELLPESRILTLMPDYLTTREPQFLSIHEIQAYNRTHMDQELVELEQCPYPKK